MGYVEPIYYPKGQIRVTCFEDSNKYLGERFQEIKERTRKEVVPSQLATSLANIFGSYQSEIREITEKVPGEWSAQLNNNQSLNISTSNIVSVGDLVGKLS